MQLALIVGGGVLLLLVLLVAWRMVGTPAAAEDAGFRRAAQMTTRWAQQSGVGVLPPRDTVRRAGPPQTAEPGPPRGPEGPATGAP